MATRGEDIVSILKQQIQQFGAAVTMVDVGTVIEVGDGICRIHGLASARYNELLQFPNDVIGIALNLEEDSVSAVILGDYTLIKEGDEVKSTGRIAEVPVGEALMGRVVDNIFGELEQFVILGRRQPVNPGYAVTYLDDRADIHHSNRRAELFYLLLDYRYDIFTLCSHPGYLL